MSRSRLCLHNTRHLDTWYKHAVTYPDVSKHLGGLAPHSNSSWIMELIFHFSVITWHQMDRVLSAAIWAQPIICKQFFFSPHMGNYLCQYFIVEEKGKECVSSWACDTSSLYASVLFSLKEPVGADNCFNLSHPRGREKREEDKQTVFSTHKSGEIWQELVSY